MKRFFTLFALVGALAAASFGAAAALSVDGGTVQAGTDTSLTCDDDGVQVLGWGLETDTGLVHNVRIGDIAETCVGNDLWAIISDGAGNELARGEITISNSQETISFTPQDAEQIEQLQLFIEGSNS